MENKNRSKNRESWEIFVFLAAVSNDSTESATSSSTNVRNIPQTVELVQPEPTDISKIGAEYTKQVFQTKKFPKDKDNRSFQPRWTDRYDWIEYSEQVDAVYCFACRQFGKSTTKDDVFMKTGFKSWKLALQTGKGFDKHNESTQHKENLASWKEKEARSQNSTQISRLLSNDVIEKRQYPYICM